ncbi:uncharacterized protein K452DRAFT_313176 [Aplosporella prunicola CBS 121167]|uniref:Uncharacterized protein n=1 Tax=Aplosporella prunicola CBS 121167 TaxID=1176127 RepID=A0A6A6AZN6_9PEZI|nr:uncharacterized protein K452DRAFT_313176 [Aplosporella prunicola CBS 121167]KAF2136425.1 hypothetical protein K452DRAFT_313176 [Aplosporella prunicola CBS 121167]
MEWLLLRPGMEVYVDQGHSGDYEPYIFKKMTFGMVNGRITDCCHYFWNMKGGRRYLHACNSWELSASQDGVFDIADCYIIPCHYVEQHEDLKIRGHTGKELRKFFEDRGQLYFKLQKKGCFDFDGVIRTPPIRPYVGQVMVDPDQWELDRRTYYWSEKMDTDGHIGKTVAAFRICNCRR